MILFILTFYHDFFACICEKTEKKVVKNDSPRTFQPLHLLVEVQRIRHSEDQPLFLEPA